MAVLNFIVDLGHVFLYFSLGIAFVGLDLGLAGPILGLVALS